MDRLGIFVDAGYLFAQGSKAITGDVVKRQALSLNEQAVIAQMIQASEDLSGGTPLLRIYWYDAIGISGPTLEQKRLSNSNNVKVRMGTLNGSGQQKGVDSMIVIDMIELARNHAISDAVLISGDEDVRVGVQFAQSYGVRVHLIGISAERDKHSQSLSLIQEADTHTEWHSEVINSFLSVRQDPPIPVKVDAAVGRNIEAPAQLAGNEVDSELFVPLIETQVNSLVHSDVTALKEHLSQSNSLPSEFDGKLLGRLRDEIGRMLSQPEKKFARKKFIELVKKRQ